MEQLTPPGEQDWADWRYMPPYPRLWAGETIEVWRSQWGDQTHFLRYGDLAPEMNVAGLYWRTA